MPRGLQLLIAAQFFSAVADNALLIVTMAVLHERGMAPWWAPLLKFAFTISYVVLAPFVGALADAWPKARLMGWMNGVKIAGVIALLVGAHPVAAFAVVGFGAAAYAPAKYGLTTELVPPQRLVAANGMLEVSVVCAVLLGTAIGGALTGSLWFDSAAFNLLAPVVASLGPLTQEPLDASLAVVLLVYALSSVVNLGVPDSGARYPAAGFHPGTLSSEFRVANRTLWQDREGGLSLAVTTIFWGVGATLQFVVLRWAADVLRLPLDRSAYLQLAVAVGVIVGAAAAGRFVALAQAHRMLVFGVAFGLAMPLVAMADRVVLAVPLLVLVGVFGGALIVPLNALLQHRGCTLLSAGRSVAVQGFNENASILLLLGIYAGLIALDVSIVAVMAGLGFAVAAAVWMLMRRARRVGNLASDRAALADGHR
jgi:LPLT family lysophospholipid transporter-like MFS transporter